MMGVGVSFLSVDCFALSMSCMGRVGVGLGWERGLDPVSAYVPLYISPIVSTTSLCVYYELVSYHSSVGERA